MLNQIKRTQNYALFGRIIGNRPVNRAHVDSLKESIKKKDLLYKNPILVTSKLEIIDGQHRLQAAKELKKAIYYTTSRGGDLDIIRLLNDSKANRPWNTNDYLQSFIDLGKEDYIVLKEFAHTYGLSLSISMLLLTDSLNNKSGTIEAFRSGEFKITNLENAKIMAERLNEIKPHTEGDAWKDREFINSLISVYEKVSHKRLMEKILQATVKVQRQANVKSYLRQFEDIYNYRLVNKIRFYE